MTPLAVKEITAARMLDLSRADFRRLVERGALPRPVPLGDTERWRVADLQAILDGKAALPAEDFE